MNYVNKTGKGFSLVEIITATFVLGLVALASYATFFSVIKLTTTSRNELEAYAEASRWLEEVEARVDYNGLVAQATPLALNNASSILQEDYLNSASPDFWPFAAKPNVSNLQADYTTENVQLGPGMPFRRVRIRVRWFETAQ